jgi:release factor glutamine methyltransferase
MQKQTKTTKPQWTILKLLKWTTSFFQSLHLDDPRTTAEMLLAHTLRSERIDLYLQYDKPLSERELAQFKVYIKRRAAREPVAYIIGRKGFWEKDFRVTKDVLIPRPETECLVTAALDVLEQNRSCDNLDGSKRVLELGTGSGAVILSLAAEKKAHRFFATDLSLKALEVARKNAEISDLCENVHFISGDWLMPFKTATGLFDMIVSNPPYIRTSEIATLQPEIASYEPLKALDGGSDGLRAIRYIIHCAYDYLVPQGSLILEIGHDQKNDVLEMVNTSGKYHDVDFIKDYAGHHRVVHLRST